MIPSSIWRKVLMRVPADTWIAAAGQGEKILLATFDVGGIPKFSTTESMANEASVGVSGVQRPYVNVV